MRRLLGSGLDRSQLRCPALPLHLALLLLLFVRQLPLLPTPDAPRRTALKMLWLARRDISTQSNHETQLDEETIKRSRRERVRCRECPQDRNTTASRPSKLERAKRHIRQTRMTKRRPAAPALRLVLSSGLRCGSLHCLASLPPLPTPDVQAAQSSHRTPH